VTAFAGFAYRARTVDRPRLTLWLLLPASAAVRRTIVMLFIVGW
jgi:hypothetical protein